MLARPTLGELKGHPAMSGECQVFRKHTHAEGH
jgi:hypothetical protein